MVKATAHRKPPVTSIGASGGVLLELGAEQLELGVALPHVGALEAGDEVAGQVVDEGLAAGEVGHEAGVPDGQAQRPGHEALVGGAGEGDRALHDLLAEARRVADEAAARLDLRAALPDPHRPGDGAPCPSSSGSPGCGRGRTTGRCRPRCRAPGRPSCRRARRSPTGRPRGTGPGPGRRSRGGRRRPTTTSRRTRTSRSRRRGARGRRAAPRRRRRGRRGSRCRGPRRRSATAGAAPATRCRRGRGEGSSPGGSWWWSSPDQMRVSGRT